MNFIETPISDLLIVEPRVFSDHRGYFFESFNKSSFQTSGIDIDFAQDNESKSVKNVVRGLHYQLAPYAQAKLIRVVDGIILDVAVDIRINSPTYGKHYSLELSAENKLQLFVPKGFAHGFSVLSETAVVVYKCDTLFNREAERGILYNDPELNIDWKVSPNSIIVSAKDRINPTLSKAEINSVYGRASSN